jgi:hypothetical protein
LCFHALSRGKGLSEREWAELMKVATLENALRSFSLENPNFEIINEMDTILEAANL